MSTLPIRHTAISIASVALILGPISAHACSSCGCTLSSDWDSQGYTLTPGLRFDLRYDYLNQSQLRTNTGTVNRGAVAIPSAREVEQGTTNHYVTLGVDYSPSRDWGVNVQLPYISRTHTTLAPTDTALSSSKTEDIGDVRVIGRYQGISEQRNIGVQFGLKLPTGSFHDRFKAGPEAGNLLDRGLQAGTGTTDFLFGLYRFGAINRDWDYFAQGMVQKALNSREAYRTGTSLNINAGVRYMAFDNVVPQIQINTKTASRDSGLQADNDNSGGTLAYFSPGATVSINKRLSVYGFVQLPVFQKVNGWQLAPHYTISIGMHYSL